jgi:hypothetical protein
MNMNIKMNMNVNMNIMNMNVNSKNMNIDINMTKNSTPKKKNGDCQQILSSVLAVCKWFKLNIFQQLVCC